MNDDFVPRKWSQKINHVNEKKFPVVLFIMLHKVVLTFESVVDIQRCYNSNESSLADLLHSNIYFLGC